MNIYLAELLEEQQGLESELDEMWSYVGKKDNPRWLWHALVMQRSLERVNRAEVLGETSLA